MNRTEIPVNAVETEQTRINVRPSRARFMARRAMVGTGAAVALSAGLVAGANVLHNSAEHQDSDHVLQINEKALEHVSARIDGYLRLAPTAANPIELHSTPSSAIDIPTLRNGNNVVKTLTPDNMRSITAINPLVYQGEKNYDGTGDNDTWIGFTLPDTTEVHNRADYAGQVVWADYSELVQRDELQNTVNSNIPVTTFDQVPASVNDRGQIVDPAGKPQHAGISAEAIIE